MRQKIDYKPRFFPFSPLPWPIWRGKYIYNPTMDLNLWRDFVQNKNIIVTALGGPLESFFSLSFIEMLASFFSKDKAMKWLGNPFYNYFVYAQGVSSISDVILTKNILEKYPTPLFMDAKENVYYNVLNNYIIRKSYWGLYPETNQEPLLQQMFFNSLAPWNYNYAVKIRKTNSARFESWKKLNNFNERKKTIIIIPQKTDSIHKYSGLGWNNHNIREFSALLYGKGIRLLVCSDAVFHGSNIKIFPYDPEIMLNLLRHSWMILSEEIDWHLIGMMVSNCISVSKINENYDLFKETEYVGRENLIYTEAEISPYSVKSIIEAL